MKARLPFDEEELEYIKSLDIEADKQLLRQELPVLREECLRTLEVSTRLLKICAEHGLSLHEIGEIMSQPIGDLENKDSELEKLCVQTKAILYEFEAAHLTHDCEDECDPDSPVIGDELQFSFDDAKGGLYMVYLWWLYHRVISLLQSQTAVSVFAPRQVLTRMSFDCRG